ncbi:MAG: sulfatase/phosphatase domain-containing protein, partial [Pseudomonadota bacterium]
PRRAAFIQYAHQKPMDGIAIRPHVHTVRDGRYRMSVFEGIDWGELYDLEGDPGEFDNLWDDPGMVAVKAQLMEQLARSEMAHVDQAPMPTGRA